MIFRLILVKTLTYILDLSITTDSKSLDLPLCLGGIEPTHTPFLQSLANAFISSIIFLTLSCNRGKGLLDMTFCLSVCPSVPTGFQLDGFP